MNWRQFLYLCLLAFVITLSLIIGWRLSDQAMAVIVGVVAGVAASIPTSLLVVWVALRARADQMPADDSALRRNSDGPVQHPQVIFVQATPAPAAPASPQAQRSLTTTVLGVPAYTAPEPTALNGLPMGSRQFTILGGDTDS